MPKKASKPSVSFYQKLAWVGALLGGIAAFGGFFWTTFFSKQQEKEFESLLKTKISVQHILLVNSAISLFAQKDPKIINCLGNSRILDEKPLFEELKEKSTPEYLEKNGREIYQVILLQVTNGSEYVIDETLYKNSEKILFKSGALKPNDSVISIIKLKSHVEEIAPLNVNELEIISGDLKINKRVAERIDVTNFSTPTSLKCPGFPVSHGGGGLRMYE